MAIDIDKEDLEEFVSEKFNNAVAFAILTPEGLVITKYGENYHMVNSAEAGSQVINLIGKISKDKNEEIP